MPRDKDNWNRWNRENIKTFSVRLSKKKDMEIISWMENHKPSNEYLKGLIRADMEKQK